jgi:putative redox protein
MKFNAVTCDNHTIPVEPSPCMGGSGENPNPIDYLLAALGSCAGIKVLMDLSARNSRPDSMRIAIAGKRHESPPAVFENLHVRFFLTGGLDEEMVKDAIHETMTLNCPVAVMMGKATNLTWDFRIGNGSQISSIGCPGFSPNAALHVLTDGEKHEF